MKTFEIGPLSIKFVNEWREWFHIKDFNWCNFHLVNLSFELDEMSKSYDLYCYLLGFGLECRYEYDFEHSEMKRVADNAYQEVMEREGRL